jgi:hypothetical protein
MAKKRKQPSKTGQLKTKAKTKTKAKSVVKKTKRKAKKTVAVVRRKKRAVKDKGGGVLDSLKKLIVG